METDKHIYLIKTIFMTFFPGVDYVIEHETSLDYLYNIRLKNVVERVYDVEAYCVSQYKFENCDVSYSSDYFISVFKGFATTLTGQILIYYTKEGKSPVLITPNQTKNDNYSIVSLLTDPYRNRFDNRY